ncbi:hypothetical protein ACFRCQ_17970 [Cytobacillus firmus]|uniref:hypothetical protein n=1 Tax=Cytobacillus firmus TaxID=1399 RepID=UPI0036945C7B
METFRVTFEMTNGESHFYEIENESINKVYEMINASPDGWVEIPYNGEKHFVKADKLTRVKIISRSDYDRIQKESHEQTINAFSNLNF